MMIVVKYFILALCISGKWCVSLHDVGRDISPAVVRRLMVQTLALVIHEANTPLIRTSSLFV